MLKLAVLLCLLAAACSAKPSSGPASSRLRPGRRITAADPVDISQYPWQISLVAFSFHNCGGSIISPTRVLTAAYCFQNIPAEVLWVRAGTSTTGSGGTVHAVANYIQHEQYSVSPVDFDIGVLEISGSFSFGDNVQPVSLVSTEPVAGTPVTITGWADGSSTQLHADNTYIVSRDSCNVSYEGDITDRMICAGDPQSACQGDTGGPLVSDATQCGILAFGNICGNGFYPVVYTNVAALRSWITENAGV